MPRLNGPGRLCFTILSLLQFLAKSLPAALLHDRTGEPNFSRAA